MRSARTALAAGALTALLVPPAALGGGFSGGGGGAIIAFETPGGARQLHQVYSGLEIKGTVAVAFHGDAAGCAAAHLCDVRGSVRWDPSGPASVAAVGYRKHGHRLEEGFLTLGFSDNAHARFPTSARVRREGVPGSLCADAAEDPFGEAHSGPRRGTAIEMRLLDLPSPTTAPGMALQTRCAGPTTADLAGLLPGHRITERGLIRGHTTLDFSADREFAAHGLAGTLHSTVTVRVLGGGRIPGLRTPGRFPRTKKHRVREVEVEYRVERVSGSVVTAVRGRADPDLCGPLDACGISGSVSIDPSASSGSAYATATAPARVTGKQLRRALGLARGARPSGLRVYGEASWQRDLGSVTADLTRLGAPACLDSMPIEGGGALFLSYGRRRVHVSYSGGSLFDEADLLRTHCPGPTGADVGGDLASASLPLRAFRQRRITLHLTRGRGFRSTAYSGHSSPDVTIVLRRTRVKERTYNEQVPTGFEYGHVHSLR